MAEYDVSPRSFFFLASSFATFWSLVRNVYIPFTISSTSVNKVLTVVLAIIHIAQSVAHVFKNGDAEKLLCDL